MNDLLERGAAHYLRQLVDNVPSMLAYWDKHLLCRFANRAYERWFGVDPDGLLGTSIRDLLGPELFALNEPYIEGALRGEQQVFERVVPGPRGERRHSLATYVPDIVDGEVVGFIAHVTEVTQLKETEASLRSEIAQRQHAYELLRHSESELRNAQRLGHIGSWEWDVATDAMVWSDELYRIFGRDPVQPAPSLPDLPALYTPESWSRVQERMLQLVKGGEPFEIELEYVRPDGKTGWLEAHAEAARGPRGEIQRLRGTCHDITLRRQVDEARIQLAVAEAANRNKTALLSRVSHDLRTPLNSILGFSQLCLGEPGVDAKRRQWLELIVAGGKHMLELVDELLDMSAAEAGQIVIRRVELDVDAAVADSLRQAAVSAHAAGLRLLAPEPSATPLRISGDPRRLKQILDNILSNAIKYTRPGGVVTTSVIDRGATVELIVRDTGVGLSGEQLARLFMPFERLGAERTAIHGTGLGMAFTKRLVELMGGEIRVDSRLGEGSTFTVSLPTGR